MTWTPKSHEAKSFEEVYIDETSQTGHRFLVIGGLVVPYHFSELFTQEILEARKPRLTAEVEGSTKLREIKWTDIGKGEFEDHKRVVDAYFDFSRKHIKSSLDNFHFLCSVIDTHVKGRTYAGTRGKLGFDREIYFHCMSVARNHRDKVFHIYPDDRETDEPVDRIKDILNRGIRKESDRRQWPFRRLKPKLSHEIQALQITDLLIGAVAFRLNRHYDAPNAREDKKRLCEHILRRGGAWEHFNDGRFRPKGFGQFQIWFRRHKSKN